MFPVLRPRSGVLVAAAGLLLARLSCCSSSSSSGTSSGTSSSGSSGPGSVPHIAAFFGTKSRYEDVNRRLRAEPLWVNRSVLRPPAAERCSPVHVTAVIRHGSRYPTVKNIRRIRRLSELVRTSGGTGGTGGGSAGTGGGSAGHWLDDIRTRWESWFTDDMDGQLVMKGREDLRLLARRLVLLFPELLTEENLRRSSRSSWRSSSKHRCVSSMEAFQEGVRETWSDTHPDPDPGFLLDDELLRFFERCRGYVEGVEKNRTALEEVHKFTHGEEVQEVRRRTAGRLGVNVHDLTPDLLEAAFFVCSYELSIKGLHSPWCFLFDEDDAKVLEYRSDLKQYWKRFHGHMISALSSCPLFHHVFRTLDKAGRPRRSTDAPPDPASVLVGHAETLLPLLALLGLYRDEAPPTAANYHAQHGRRFRSGWISPYAANVLFVLYDCRRGPRLQLLVNESPVRFPGLDSEDVPLYRDVRAAYRHLLDGCDFHKECEGRSLARGPNTEL